MTSPFFHVLLLFHDFGSSVAQATHEPVVVVTDWSVPDRCIEGIGSVIRRWGWYRSLWMESHSSKKAPPMCLLQ